ncbi:MAG: glycosyltransferase family 39 protein [Deltaproteobacteria bacterium]|nr:glycosyltransferase family 39 protein [Deltaproteobacteria bacterium]
MLRRLAVSAIAAALLAAAWRAQTAFQFGDVRLPHLPWMVAATVGLWLLWLLTLRRTPAPAAPLARRTEWLAVLALCGLGAWFRLVHFGSVPEGMNHDAAFNGMFALDALQGAPYTPYISAAWGRETLFMYLCTALVAVFGNTMEPIQLAATLVGLATLPIFYCFARALVGPRLALLGLALLAVSGWHGVFSRVGWRMIMVPPFTMLALLGLWRGLEGRRWGWVLAGAGAAGAIYTYDAGRIVPPMVGALFLAFAPLQPSRWRLRALGAFVTLATFLLVGAPMLYYAATHFEQFKARAAHLADEHSTQHMGVLANAGTALAMFHYRGNGNDFFIDEPLLEPLAAVLVGFGLLIALTRIREPASRFLLIGFGLALLPGVLAVPNGNRCIPALPFVYVFGAMGLGEVVRLLGGWLSGQRNSVSDPDLTTNHQQPNNMDGGHGGPRYVARALPIALAVVAIAIAGSETYREFLGEQRRRILGFSPEATAAGTYLRRFDQDRYARYVVAEDWPEYTLAYLSYNGGGTPMENHYLIGRTLDDISDRINRYGRKGLVFATDLKPAGRAAFDSLSRLFADHRVEPILAPRVGDRPVGQALIVEPQSAGRTALWSNTTRALAVGGDATASGMRCFAPVGGASGVSLRLQLMRPALPPVEKGGQGGLLHLLADCRAHGRPLLTLAFTPRGLEANQTVLIASDRLEAGRWYDLLVQLPPRGAPTVFVDRVPVALAAVAPTQPLSGVSLSAPAGQRFYLDDLLVVAGVLAPDAEQWQAAARPPGAFDDDFEATPLGLLTAGGDWRTVVGPLAALASPAPHASGAPPAASPGEGGNAFDGGPGASPGHFDQPMGMAFDPDGNLLVADRNNHRIQEFDRNGDFVRAWGRYGEAAGEFKEPHDVAADREFIYVADTWNQRIQGFTPDGVHAFTFTGQPSLSSPRGIAVDHARIYVVEAGGGRVTVYDRDGHLLQTYGAPGSGPGQLIEPTDVVVDGKGDVWVLNTGNNRIEHFAADGRALDPVPIAGWTGNRLKEVYLAIDAQGTLYVGDWDLGAVRRFRPDGTELEPLGDKLRSPTGLVVDPTRVLVALRGENVVRVLSRPAP